VTRMMAVFCANVACNRAIHSPRPGQRYCSDHCRKVAWDRRNGVFTCVHCGGLNHLTNRGADPTPEGPLRRSNGVSRIATGVTR